MSLGITSRFTVQPVVAASLLHCLSQGILFTQAGSYAASCDDDSTRLKCYVTLVMLLAFFQTILEIAKLWIIAVFQQSWDDLPIAFLDLFVNGLTCTLVEAFLIRRCWKVSGKNSIVLVALSALATSTLTSNIYLAVRFHDVTAASGISHSSIVKGNVAFSYWMFGSFSLDISITTILLVFLLRSKTGLEHLDAVVDRIMHITWESASLPAVFVIISVSIYLSKMGGTEYELVLLFACMTGKLYCHGLLRTLNARPALRERLHDSKLGRRSLTSSGMLQSKIKRGSQIQERAHAQQV